MRAMVLEEPKSSLKMKDLPIPVPQSGQVLVKVIACGICRTDLHIIDGELPAPKLPLILGHQIVGIVEKLGSSVTHLKVGDRIGIPWLGGTCQHCKFCLSGRENLCDSAIYTGYQVDGGYAEYCVANEQFCFPIPPNYSSVEAAPLLCGGLIGYRAYRKAGDAKKIGFYGFGSAAHMLCQVAVYENRQVYAFTREGDKKTQDFALSLGATWAGASTENPPEPLDAALVFAPDGSLMPVALQAVEKGGKVISAGIHMSDIPSFPYSILWEERILTSVANLTRKDGEELLKLAPKIPIKPQVTLFKLDDLNEALKQFREGHIKGTAVILLEPGVPPLDPGKG